MERLTSTNAPKNPFSYHKPSEAMLPTIEGAREAFKTMNAHLLSLPPCRERSLAITKLEEAAMWAVKGLVMNDEGAMPMEPAAIDRLLETLPGVHARIATEG
jgi:hypothetical protein